MKLEYLAGLTLVIFAIILTVGSAWAGTQYTTMPATNITATSATLNGNSLSTVGLAGEIFHYGETQEYGNAITASPQGVNGPVSATITGLKNGTIYHFKFTGTPFPPRTTLQGSDLTFTTQTLPIPSTSKQIKDNIKAMLETPTSTPVKPLADIPGGAPNATLSDAAYFMWQNFVSLSWPAVGQQGLDSTGTPLTHRETPDVTKKFGQPAGSGMVTMTVGGKSKEVQVSYPGLVWETTRHKSEIYPGQGAPHGYQYGNATKDYGYDDLPQYVYGSNVTITPSTDVKKNEKETILVPWVNLDENNQIAECQMYTGLPPENTAPPGPGRLNLFLAKANRIQYEYAVSRGWWYQGDVLKRAIQNTTNYTVVKKENPPAGMVDGSTTLESLVSFPNSTFEFKAAWRLLTVEEKKLHYSTGVLPGYHTAPIRYYVETGTNQFEYVDTVGALQGLHIIHKTPTAPYFVFATFEHKDNIRDKDGNPVEDADGRLNEYAKTNIKPQGPPMGYLLPSTPQNTKEPFLKSATTSDVFTKFSSGDKTSNKVVVQQFMPDAATASTGMKDNRSYYINTKTSDLPSANSAMPVINVNRRRYTIPQDVINVNQDLHSLIKQYGYQTDNPWLNYKLVNVQWKPVDKPAGQLYEQGGTRDLDPATYYLGNSVVETDIPLSAFSGQFGPYPTLTITDYYFNSANLPHTYTYPVTSSGIGSQHSVTKKIGDPFYNVYYNNKAHNMGGCMGCHGNASVAGTDFSFIFGFPVMEPDSAEPITTEKDVKKMLMKRYFLPH